MFSCNDVDVLFTFNFDLDLKLAFLYFLRTQNTDFCNNMPLTCWQVPLHTQHISLRTITIELRYCYLYINKSDSFTTILSNNHMVACMKMHIVLFFILNRFSRNSSSNPTLLSTDSSHVGFGDSCGKSQSHVKKVLNAYIYIYIIYISWYISFWEQTSYLKS